MHRRNRAVDGYRSYQTAPIRLSRGRGISFPDSILAAPGAKLVRGAVKEREQRKVKKKRFPLTHGITDRFADAALRQEAPSRLPAFQGLLDSSDDRTALTASIGITERDARALFS
jgi:hypothetical protein